MPSLRRNTIRGVFWSSVERFSVQGIQFVLSLVIARQLMPSDYGLIAMLGIFMAIAQSFIDSGFSSALIQKQDRTETDYSTVFYFNIAVGIAIYFLFRLVSPAIAAFYEQEALEDISVWVALNFIISAFSTVQRAKLTISLDFKRQAVISLVSVTVSGGTGIWMAYSGFGVWTLVFMGLLNNGINTLLLWISAKWRPRAVFSMASFRELFGFGSKLLLGGLLHTLYTNLYSLVIGKVYSSSQLGLFNQASRITQYPSTNISGIITRVTYPVECRMQNDNSKLQDKFFTFIRLTSFVVFPLMTGLAAVASPMVELVLTEKWNGCVPYLRIMCFAYMWDPVMRMSWDLLNAKKRSDLSLKSEIIKKAVAFAILFATIPFGLEVICIGLVAYSISDVLIITSFTRRILPRVTFANEMKTLLPILIQSLAMGASVYLFVENTGNIWIQVFGGILTGILSYIAFSFIFCRKLLSELWNIIRNKY